MKDQKAESLQSMTESATPADLWDFISNDTEIDRHICKTVIFHMLHGTQLVEVAIKHGLAVDVMTDIRAAFDQYTYEHKKEETDAIHQTS
jgi:hypothetical protein